MSIFVGDNESMNSVFIRTHQQETERLKVQNRRTARRHDVKMPLQYRISEGKIASPWKCSQTIDMSVDAILIDTAKALPLGTKLELAIDWPGLYHGKPMVHLLVIGSVVRNDRRGTALRILNHEFRDVRPAVVHPRRAERDRAVA